MPTRNVRLTDHQAELIDALVASGRYQNASEVMREGLRMVEVREAEEASTLQWFNEQIAKGVAEARQGEFVGTLDEVMEKVDAKLDAEDGKAA